MSEASPNNLTSETVPTHRYNLFELTPEERQELSERIERWQGLVRIFIHPMYEKWRGHEEKYLGDPEYIKLVQIEQVLSKLLAVPEDKTPPMIILEEAEHIQKLEKWLAENPLGQSQNGVYFAKTRANNPTPTDAVGTDWDAWREFSDLLEELGVKKILIGGMQLEVSGHKTDWTEKDPWVGRCVGIALSHLSKDKAGKFEVDLSALTYPTGEREKFVAHRKNKDIEH